MVFEFMLFCFVQIVLLFFGFFFIVWGNKININSYIIIFILRNYFIMLVLIFILVQNLLGFVIFIFYVFFNNILYIGIVLLFLLFVNYLLVRKVFFLGVLGEIDVNQLIS